MRVAKQLVEAIVKNLLLGQVGNMAGGRGGVAESNADAGIKLFGVERERGFEPLAGDFVVEFQLKGEKRRGGQDGGGESGGKLAGAGAD